MSTKTTLFTVAGITTHRGQNSAGVVSERTKCRVGTDLVRMIKMLSNPKKIEDKTLGICLAPVRVDMIELPTPMLKDDAVKFLLSHPDFQSASDQAVISETIDHRAPRAPRVKKEKVVKVKAADLSLDAIRSRKRSEVSVEQVLSTVTE